MSDYYSDIKRYQSNHVNSFYHKYVEKPAIYSLLDDISGKSILCIGVGTGEEAKFISDKGAQVTALDLNEDMINFASQEYPGIKFEVKDMDKLEYSSKSFDIIVLSLSIHYSKDYLSLLKNCYRMLKDKGQIIFSTMHPNTNSYEKIEIDGWKFTIQGIAKNFDGTQEKYFGNYFNEEEKSMDWDKTVVFQHRTIETLLNGLIDTGFVLKRFLEPKPLEESKIEFKKYYERYVRRPVFVIVQAIKA